jgi:hypothetical protein
LRAERACHLERSFDVEMNSVRQRATRMNEMLRARRSSVRVKPEEKENRELGIENSVGLALGRVMGDG